MATKLRVLAISILLASAGAAQQASFSNTGGTVTLGTDLALAGSNLTSPAGTVSLSCPVTALPPGTYSAEWVCNGGAITIQSNDGLTTVTGALTSGTLIETATGGGRGVPTTYWYSFSGAFTGTMTMNGQTEAITGQTAQYLAGMTSHLGTGTISSASTYVNATYEPLYIADTSNNRIVRIDDMTADNWTALGKAGAGTKQFNLPWGIYMDATGAIYVTDSGNCRVVRMNDMSGTGWTSLGTCGSGSHQFNNPTGIFIDPAGKIYIADTGNNRVVRVNNIAGDSWTAYGAAGAGTGQFSQPEGIAADAVGKVYVADGGNGRVVRMDDMAGTNWTTYGDAGPGAGQFDTAVAVSLDTAGKIYVVDVYNNRVVRMDDMLGTNLTVLGGTLGAGVGQFINPYGMYIDSFGTIYVSDTHDNRITRSDTMTASGWAAVGTCCLGTGQFNLPVGVYAAPPKTPVGVATLSAASLAFGFGVVGTSSPAQTITLANIGSAALTVASITPAGDFVQTNTCAAALPAGQSCTVSVSFAPSAGGSRTGSIAFNFGSAGAKNVSLTGTGTLVSVSPTSLNFGNVNAGGRPVSMTVTVANPGVAAAGISSVALSAPPVYRLSNKCPISLAVGASCTLSVRFAPQGAKLYNGTLTITDASGTAQKVTITGVGVSN